MNFIKRLTALVRKKTLQEQIAGYSIPELKKTFSRPLAYTSLPTQPPTTSLEDAGVGAFYSQFLVNLSDFVEFETIIKHCFQKTAERSFNGHLVFEYKNVTNEDQLIFFSSTSEFNSVTVRLVTDSMAFLTMLSDKKFAVPPPWVAFEGYEPSWWGGDMQGAQGYYNDSYFMPYFSRLSSSEKQSYYAKFHATDEWIARLDLLYNDE